MYGYQGGERAVEGTGRLGLTHVSLLILRIKQVNNENLLYSAGNSIHCDDLDEKEAQAGGDRCICMADSFCFSVETYTTSQSKYTLINIKNCMQKVYSSLYPQKCTRVHLSQTFDNTKFCTILIYFNMIRKLSLCSHLCFSICFWIFIFLLL